MTSRTLAKLGGIGLVAVLAGAIAAAGSKPPEPKSQTPVTQPRPMMKQRLTLEFYQWSKWGGHEPFFTIGPQGVGSTTAGDQRTFVLKSHAIPTRNGKQGEYGYQELVLTSSGT